MGIGILGPEFIGILGPEFLGPELERTDIWVSYYVLNTIPSTLYFLLGIYSNVAELDQLLVRRLDILVSIIY